MTLDPLSHDLFGWWLDMSLRSGFLLALALLFDRGLRGAVEPSIRAGLYLPVWLRLMLPADVSSPIAAMPEVSKILLPVQAAGAVSGSPPAGREIPVLVVLWALVSLFLAARLLLARRRFDRELSRATFPDDTLVREVGLSVPILVHASLGPLVCGVWSPVLVLPSALARVPLSREARCAILHEEGHLKNHHLLLSAMIQISCVALWPVLPLWVASRRLHALMEQQADRYAVSKLPEGAVAYGRALVGIGHTSPATPIGGFPMAAYDNLRERIHALLTPARLPRMLALPLVAALTLGALGLAAEVAASEPAQSEKSGNWLEVELGSSILIRLPRDAERASTDNLSVAEVKTLDGQSLFQINGRKLGETKLTFAFSEGKPIEYLVEVVPLDTATFDKDALDISVGETLSFALPKSSSRVSVDPAFLEIRSSSPERAEVVGLKQGRTELVIFTAGESSAPLVYQVLVK